MSDAIRKMETRRRESLMEEKKDKKKKYEKPVVVKIGAVDHVAGRCHTGAVDATCAGGPGAHGGSCQSGGSV